MYDVIVVGAGPAGSTCARTCAQQGLKTLLLDRDTFPRSKPCAGAVSLQALSYLDFRLPDSLIEEECNSVRVHHDGYVVHTKRDAPFAVVVTRKYFDALLAEKAVESAADFQMNEQVIAVRDAKDFVEVATKNATYRSLFLAGADGIHSLVAHTLRPPLDKGSMALALVSQISANEQDIRSRVDKTLDLYFGTAPVGYGWLFPHRGYLSTGIAGLAARFSKPREALANLAKALNIELSDVHGHYIPLGGIRRRIAGGRILLTGDAAGFADPFHGEGISHAILSGRLAANAIIAAIKNHEKPAAVVTRYRREADQRIRKQLRIALRMAYLVDRYPRVFLRIFCEHPEAMQRFLDIPAGRSDYRHFQRWLLTHLPFLLLPGNGSTRTNTSRTVS
ncbi:MAG TPA: geranylgeranyl reductase family protein [Nitrospirota bacterium]|nr:geranylgeranyl reductase family protein [Nitrospirota bacterium]